MLKYPQSYELIDYQSLLSQIPQKGPFWCIPACFENMLKYVGINDISQEELVLNYCRKFGNDALIIKQDNSHIKVKIDTLTDEEVIHAAKNSVLRHANFGTIKDAAEKSSKFDLNRFELDHITGVNDSNEYLDILKSAISSQEPVLIASMNPNGSSHIRVVCAYDNSNIVLYDTALDDIITVATNTITFNSDMLVLRKK